MSKPCPFLDQFERIYTNNYALDPFTDEADQHLFKTLSEALKLVPDYGGLSKRRGLLKLLPERGGKSGDGTITKSILRHGCGDFIERYGHGLKAQDFATVPKLTMTSNIKLFTTIIPLLYEGALTERYWFYAFKMDTKDQFAGARVDYIPVPFGMLGLFSNHLSGNRELRELIRAGKYTVNEHETRKHCITVGNNIYAFPEADIRSLLAIYRNYKEPSKRSKKSKEPEGDELAPSKLSFKIPLETYLGTRSVPSPEELIEDSLARKRIAIFPADTGAQHEYTLPAEVWTPGLVPVRKGKTLRSGFTMKPVGHELVDVKGEELAALEATLVEGKYLTSHEQVFLMNVAMDVIQRAVPITSEWLAIACDRSDNAITGDETVFAELIKKAMSKDADTNGVGLQLSNAVDTLICALDLMGCLEHGILLNKAKKDKKTT